MDTSASVETCGLQQPDVLVVMGAILKLKQVLSLIVLSLNQCLEGLKFFVNLVDV